MKNFLLYAHIPRKGVIAERALFKKNKKNKKNKKHKRFKKHGENLESMGIIDCVSGINVRI